MESVAIGSVIVPSGRRSLRKVEQLADSIKEIGLLNPITITPEKRLVAGYHRLEACRSLGWTEIPAMFCTLEGLTAELAEIDENLIRNELTELEQSEHLVRRKEIYEQLHPETKAGVAGGKASGASRRGEERTKPTVGFVQDTAEKTDKSLSTVKAGVQIATKIPKDVRDALRDTDTAKRKRDLLSLARLAEEQQRKIADKIASGEAKGFTEAKRQTTYETKHEVHLQEVVSGRYPVLYADPPWQYRNSGFDSSAAEHYPTQPTEELCKMPVPAHTTDDAVLFLWVTNPLLPDGLRLMEAWGFAYKTNLVWVKDRQTPIGFYCYGKHELLLIGTKGSFLPRNLVPSVIDAERAEHSRKPDEAYTIIETMYPGGPYLELFARRARNGWASFGNEMAE